MAKKKEKIFHKKAFVPAGIGYIKYSLEFTIMQAIAQLMLNCFDAKAETAAIEIDNKIRDMIIADNGFGMDLDKLEHYLIAGVPDPSKMEDPEASGNQGTGKTACITLAVEYVLRTKIAHEDCVWEMYLSEQMLRDAANSPEIDIPIKQTEKLDTDPDTPSFTKIHLKGVRQEIDIEEVRKNLDRYLKRKYSTIVIINSEPIEPFVIKGTKITYNETFKNIGKVEAEIIIPDEATPDDIHLEMSAVTSVCPIRDFYRLLSRKQQAAFPPVYLSSLLVGYIDVPYFNKKYTLPSRGKFSADLMSQDVKDPQSDLATFLNALRFLAPKLDEALGLVKDVEEQAKDQELMDRLKDEVGKIGGKKKKKKKPEEEDEKQGRITPHNIEVEQNAEVVFKLDPPEAIEDPVWDVKGGKILSENEDKKGIVYKAGIVNGTFTVKVSSEKDSERVFVTQITIVDESRFFSSPRQITLMPGETCEIKIKKKSKKTGDILWQAFRSGGTIDRSCGDSVIYTAGEEEGKFELIASDARQGSVLVAKTVIIIAKEKPRKKGKGDDYLEFMGLKFEIGLVPLVRKDKLYHLQQSQLYDDVFVLKFNKYHPRWIASDTDKARIYFLQDVLMMAFLEAQHGDDSDEAAVVDKIGVLSGKYFAEKQKKKSKK